MKILSFARMWGLPWWKENVTDRVPPEGRDATGKISSRIKARAQADYDVVCCGGNECIWYPFYLRLYGKKAAAVMGEMFLPEPKPGFAWKIKRSIRRFLYRKIDRFVVYSTGEKRLWADYLGYDESLFSTVLFASNLLDPERYPEGLRLPEGNYGLAAGRSGRDYRTFFEAVRDLDYPFVVVADRESVEGLEVPENVTLHCDIPWEQYLELLRKAAFTVVPLHDWPRSLGQVVILEGYAFGKPTVATRAIGTTDYVFDGETGLLVPPYDPPALKAAIEELREEERRLRMGEEALKQVRTRFSPSAFLESYRVVLEEAVRSFRSRRR